MMIKCRQYSPDLILLNHRLGLQKAKPYATTSLWEGHETYIDVFMTNDVTAPHNRAGALTRGLPPEMKRLTEDHGVCLSSCLDYWEDDMVLQAFNRSMILAPELYGNPWLLRDDEFSQLARFFNLHKKYSEILVDGIELPKSYGPNAVSRGDATRRIITLRNLSWADTTYTLKLDEEIGLKKGSKIKLVQWHPTEKVIGTFAVGDKVEIEVNPFRACMLFATSEKYDEPSVNGVDYKVICDVENQPIQIELLGRPGQIASVSINNSSQFSEAVLRGKSNNSLVKGKSVKIKFDGQNLLQKTHRKLADLKTVDVPSDAVALYEATVFSADNNALEVRSIQRSGYSSIPEV
jgi:hypothetical protein